MMLPCVKDKCAYCEGMLFYVSVCLFVRDIGETLGEQIIQHIYASNKLANRHVMANAQYNAVIFIQKAIGLFYSIYYENC